MPKATKNKPASKSTGLKRRFDLTNKKVQFFVVIAIVAVLGGGWFTLKSFANSVTYRYQPSDLTLSCNMQFSPPGSCERITESTSGQKNGAIVIKMKQNGTVNGNRNTLFPDGNESRMCYTAKGNGEFQYWPTAVGPNSYPNGNMIKVFSPDSYFSDCTQWRLGFQSGSLPKILVRSGELSFQTFVYESRPPASPAPTPTTPTKQANKLVA